MDSNAMLGKLVRSLTTVPAHMLGTLGDLAEKLGGEKGGQYFEELKLMLRRAPISENCTLRVNEYKALTTVYFSTTSEGTTGCDWLTELEANNISVAEDRRAYLLNDFTPTSGKNTNIAIIVADTIYAKSWLQGARNFAEEKKLNYPSPEVCLLVQDYMRERNSQLYVDWLFVDHGISGFRTVYMRDRSLPFGANILNMPNPLPRYVAFLYVE